MDADAVQVFSSVMRALAFVERAIRSATTRLSAEQVAEIADAVDALFNILTSHLFSPDKE